MSTNDPVKQSWQSSVTEPSLPSLDAVHQAAGQFFRKVRRRNRIEYAACVVIVIVFTGYTLFLPNPFVRLGAALVVLGTLIVAWQLHRRASPIPLEQAGTMPILAFQRAQLVRQRDALASVFWWYLLPFLPGFVLMMAGPRIGAMRPLHWPEWVSIVVTILIFGGTWQLNRWGARRLQKWIDTIDALDDKGA